MANLNGTTVAVVKTAVVDVLLCLERDTVTVSSKGGPDSKGGVKEGKTLILALPILRKTSRDLYDLLVTNDEVQDGESVAVEMTYDQMKVALSVSKLSSGDVLPVPVSTPAPVKVAATVTVKTDNAANDAAIVQKAYDRQMCRPSASVSEERRIRSAQRVLDTFKDQDLLVMNYYLPTPLTQAWTEEDGTEYDIRIPSPALWLHGLAISLDGSNWMMTASASQDKRVKDFQALVRQYHNYPGKRGGARCWIRKQHEEEKASLVEQALESLRLHIVALHTSMIDAIDKADHDLQDAEEKWEKELIESGKATTPEAVAKATADRNNGVRAALKSAADNLTEALKMAEEYDASEHVEDLFSAYRKAIRAERDAFNASVAGVFTLKGRAVKGSDVVV